jgi:hypothetical protein
MKFGIFGAENKVGRGEGKMGDANDGVVGSDATARADTEVVKGTQAVHPLEQEILFPEPYCHDCGAAPGQMHTSGCDVERCPACGDQAISCPCSDKVVRKWSNKRQPWTGVWPGVKECQEYNFWCKRGPGKGWVPCDKADPEAREDLGRLERECEWNPELQKWEKKCQ